ncbi:MAG: 3-phosphoshikimate 1-carboxyvinyltransferase [Bacteroidia bacterium]|nr:3-phosphoshikimate 1-carboxyvinyltransferase [Bacteroidia bacterium]
MAFRLSFSGSVKNCEVGLTASKSISNRALIIQALCEEPFQIENLSTSTDTEHLQAALKSKSDVIDVYDAGTSFRFLTSYFAIKPGSVLLTGSARMKLRPIGPLVDSLRKLGASIEYAEEFGFPPLRISGKKLLGGEVSIDRSLSSQFVSSLLMIAPLFEKGLTIHLSGRPSSDSYLMMTLQMMEYFGVEADRTDNRIIILPQKYSADTFFVESDWSAASYWYSLCALNPGSEFILYGLNNESFQGDRIIADIMQDFGVQTKFENGRILISSDYEKLSDEVPDFKFDFTSNPDLVMTIAVLCAAKGIHGTFTGVSSLRIKESDRLLALKSELGKCGVEVVITENECKVVPGSLFKQPGVINTFNDHRIAMAFAPLASVLDSISFDNIDVVAKSYPEFWDQMEACGLKLNEE